MALIEHLLRTSCTWALVDGLAVNVTGDLAERFSEVGPVLDRWAADEDFWLRRSALLALLRPLRAGDGDFERFSRYADAMLGEQEFFIRKGIGWVLREVAKRRPALVADWLGQRVHLASGVTVREAVKPLPATMRTSLMTGYRDKIPIRWEHLEELQPDERPARGRRHVRHAGTCHARRASLLSRAAVRRGPVAWRPGHARRSGHDARPARPGRLAGQRGLPGTCARPVLDRQEIPLPGVGVPRPCRRTGSGIRRRGSLPVLAGGSAGMHRAHRRHGLLHGRRFRLAPR